MKEWITVLKAADAAARWDVHQRRKGAAIGGLQKRAAPSKMKLLGLR
jgi:hypothetical protein